MYVCKGDSEGASSKKNRGKNQADTYYFDIEKCKQCPFKEGCYKKGAKSKTYSVSIKSTEHSEQKVFQESKYFKEKAKERYQIEAKNSELKHNTGIMWPLPRVLLACRCKELWPYSRSTSKEY